MDVNNLIACGRELNANVPFTGISMTSDVLQIKVCLSGILIALNELLATAYKNARFANLRGMTVFLQTLCKIIPCAGGYKSFVEIEEIDTRILLLHLIRFDDDFINYWALEVLSALCICPFSPRNTQQEFVNKHALLTDSMLHNLVELMSTRIDSEDEDPGVGVTAAATSITETNSNDPKTLDDKVVSTGGETKDIELFFPNSLVIVGIN
jgi:hypothetical protein